MDLETLLRKYESVPFEMKQSKRWICYKKAKLGNGTESKSPISPLSDGTGMAKADDPATWADFETAVRFCFERKLDGIGYELNGSGIYAISIKNRVNLSQKEYQSKANELIKALDSYTEWGDKGEAIHVFLYGSKTPLEQSIVKIHAGTEYMDITGEKIGHRAIRNADEELASFIDSLVNKASEDTHTVSSYPHNFKKMSDAELIDMAESSKNGEKFGKLMRGNIFDYKNETEAKQALCNFIMWYSDCDFVQSKRIFEGCDLGKRANPSEIDELLRNAADKCVALNESRNAKTVAEKPIEKAPSYEMNIDEEGKPIFHISDTKKNKSNYTLDDTGNARRFYDYFGEHFRWDAANQYFMFWTGTTWKVDVKGYIRKYANKLVEMLREESAILDQRVKDATSDERKKELLKLKDAFDNNLKRLANKAGKDAMLFELRSIGGMSVEPTEFDKDKDLLNTPSGIVNLRTGEIMPHDRRRMMSLNTNTKVSYEEPTEFIAFLRSILPNKTQKDSDDSIEFIQRLIGYTLTGYTSEQSMSIWHGDGSNGKSTMANVLTHIIGDYGASIKAEQLMAKPNSNSSVDYSLAELMGKRFLLTQETDEGDTLKESLIKGMTGEDRITARRPYGRPFDYYPIFKLAMMTNNLPSIRGTDYGIWRRINLIPFYKQFKEEEKDKELPERLAKEYDKILGWAIKGSMKWFVDHELHYPACMKAELSEYRNDNDVVQLFIIDNCDAVESQRIRKTILYEAFKEWAKNFLGWSLSEPKFRKILIRKGFSISVDENGVAFYNGVCLKSMAKWTPVSDKKKFAKPEDILE